MKSFMTSFLGVIFVSNAVFAYNSTYANTKAEELYNLIVNGHEKNIPPCIGCGVPLDINITFDLTSLNDLDEVLGEMNSIGYLTLVWFDDRISWNPADYANLYSLMVPVDKVWTPRLLVGNPSKKVSTMNSDVVLVRLMFNGQMIWTPGDVFLTKCYADIYRYPYDVQECYITVLPWAMTAAEVVLKCTIDTVSKPHYIDNGEWVLKKTHAMSYVEGVSSIARFTFTYSRRPQFVVVNVILPIVLLSYLNCLVYLLPTESGERVSYSITVLLSFAVFMTLVSDNIPKTSDPMSLLCYYLISVFIGSTMVTISTIFNMRIFYRNDTIPISAMYRSLVKCATKEFDSNPKVCPATNPTVMTITELETKDALEISGGKELLNDPVAKDVKRLETEEEEAKKMTWKDVAKALDTLSLAVFVCYFTGFTVVQLLFISIPTSS